MSSAAAAAAAQLKEFISHLLSLLYCFTLLRCIFVLVEGLRKAVDLFLHHGLFIFRLYHVQLGLLGIQLSLSLLKVHISYGQTILLHRQVSLRKKGGERERDRDLLCLCRT